MSAGRCGAAVLPGSGLEKMNVSSGEVGVGGRGGRLKELQDVPV